MHEFSLCQGLVSALYKQPLNKSGRHLHSIEVTVGPLSGVESELLAHAYPLVVENTPFAKIKMRLKKSKIVVRCKNCKALSRVKINDLRCAECGCDSTVIVEGNECALTHLYYGETDYV